jgi:hypothetical protein
MKTNSLPSNLNPSIGFNFKPCTVYMVYTATAVVTSDEQVAVNMNKYDCEETDNIRTRGDADENGNVRVPVVSFDGYNVMLLDNCDDIHIEAVKDRDTYNTRQNLDKKYSSIHAFSFDSIDTSELTEEGVRQYNSACVSMEAFEKTITYKKKETTIVFGPFRQMKTEKPPVQFVSMMNFVSSQTK